MTLLKNSLPELHREFGVKTLGVFGSFARDEANDKSDLDVLMFRLHCPSFSQKEMARIIGQSESSISQKITKLNLVFPELKKFLSI